MNALRRSLPLNIATVGLGNWAGTVVDLILRHQARPDASVRLVSVFEPNLAAHPARTHLLQTMGIELAPSYAALLGDPQVEAVLLPVPIHLHRPMTESALAAGKPVLVEKPASGCVQDVDAMMAARDSANLPVLVSFQDTYDPAMRTLKRMILDQRIGAITSTTLIGCWPRSDAYYRRCDWAGHAMFENTWVLDSPVNNAFAHYLHLIFYLLGESENVWATPARVEAELYRVNDIENYDTASQRIWVGEIPVMVYLTHACLSSYGPKVTLQGTKGSIVIDLEHRIVTVTSATGADRFRLSESARECVLEDFTRYVRGEPTNGSVSTLEASRNQVLASNGASQCALVRTVSDSIALSSHNSEGEPCRAIPGIEQTFVEAATRGEMLHESRLVNWSVPAGHIDLNGYTQFTGCPRQEIFAEPAARAQTRQPEHKATLLK